jgi:hypothetical protein
LTAIWAWAAVRLRLRRERRRDLNMMRKVDLFKTFNAERSTLKDLVGGG